MGYQQLLPIVVEKTVKLSGLDWENQCILNAQSEIGFFPAGEGSLYANTPNAMLVSEPPEIGVFGFESGIST